MKTITQLEILEMAYDRLLVKIERAQRANEQFKKDHKRYSDLSIAFIARYTEQIKEVSEEICRLKKEEEN